MDIFLEHEVCLVSLFLVTHSLLNSSLFFTGSGEAGAAVRPELQTDFYAGGRPGTDLQHQGAAPQIRPRA